MLTQRDVEEALERQTQVLQGKAGKLAQRQLAQDILMDAISVALGYGVWERVLEVNERAERDGTPDRKVSEAQATAFRAVAQQQADRVARLFGFERAWSS